MLWYKLLEIYQGLQENVNVKNWQESPSQFESADYAINQLNAGFVLHVLIYLYIPYLPQVFGHLNSLPYMF